MSATVRDLIENLLYGQDTVAITLEQALRPLIGRTVYPASYATDEKGKARYCITELRAGQNVCVIDSVPSQANRIEHAWATEATYADLFPKVTVAAKLHDGSTSQRSIMELGHRAADGAVQASDLDQDFTKALRDLAADPASPVALARLSPTSLLMGLWDSRPNRSGLKLPRAFSATIEATDVAERARHAQYNSAWHAVALDKELQDAMKGIKPSEIGLDGAPAGDALGGVEVFGQIKRMVWLAAVPLRSNLALKGTRPSDAAHALTAEYVAALGLLALTMPASPWLRSGCNLLPDGEAGLQLVSRDGKTQPIALGHKDVLDVLHSLARDMKLEERAGKISKDSLTKLVAAAKKDKKDE